uniref:Uncharacterized protein n=1 Tax=Magallana gigas TaxID=29159 RepID=A0A8W8KLY9_MAGGI|nr:uncharacterized protein LOC117680792 [Crassostrea gigas]
MQCMLIPFLLFIEAFILNVVNSIMSTVSVECPTNETWRQRSASYICTNPQEYHCLPTLFLNESVEICLTVELIQGGVCVIYNPYLKKASFDSESSCVGKTNFSGCPNVTYNSNEIYLYPSCQKINPVKQCYLADSTCPNITSNDPTVITVTSNPGGTSDAWSLSPLVWIYLISGLVFIQF